MEVSIGRDRGQEPSNRECPDHIGAIGTYVLYRGGHAAMFSLQLT